MDKEQIKNKIDNTGHVVDDWVEDTAEKHSFPKWKVWLGLAVALLLVGLAITTIK